MRISLYTQAEFGKKKNLKSPEARAMVRGIRPSSVHCRDFDFSIFSPFLSQYEKIVPFGGLFPKLLTGLNLITGGVFGLNKVQRDLLDLFASRKEDDADMLIFHPSTFARTIAKNKNKITVNVCTGLPDDLSVLSMSDYVITFSTVIRDCLLDAGFNKYRVFTVNLGVDMNKYPRPESRDFKKFVVLCVADFQKVKGLDYLLQAWKEQNIIDAELWLVGNKDKYCRKLIDDARDDRIKDIPHCDPLPYYQEASVLVLPSRSEGWGNVVTEAMSTGLPVIVSDMVGASDAVVDGVNGFVVPVGDVKKLGNKIVWYYLNPQLLKEHGESAYDMMFGFSWEKFEKNFRFAIDNIRRKESA